MVINMRQFHLSVIKALILVGIVIVSGIVVGLIFLQKTYPVIDLKEWVDKENLLPVNIYLSFDSRVEELPTLTNNTMGLEVLLPSTTFISSSYDWVLYTEELVSRNKTSNSITTKIDNHVFLLTRDNITQITKSLQTSVSSALMGQKLSYEEYRQFRHQYFETDPNRFFSLAFFVGTDDIMVFMEFTDQSFTVYACTVEQMRDQTASGIITPVVGAEYYFINATSFAEALQTSYISTWNSTLQSLFNQT